MLNLNEYPRLTNLIGQINSASYLSEYEGDFIVTGSVINYPFTSTKNAIEISAYDMSQEKFLTWKTYSSSVEQVDSDSVYTDLNGSIIHYSYTKNQTQYSVIRGRNQKVSGSANEIILNPKSDIHELGLSNSAYNLVYNFVSNEVGDIKNKFRIIEVSPSRKEIKATLNTNDSYHTKEQLNAFLDNHPFGNEIIPTILNNIERFKLQDSYFIQKDLHPQTADALKFYYSLKTDIDVINFIDSIFFQINSNKRFTVYYQFQNFLYSRYNTVLPFEEVNSKYENIIDVVVKYNLQRITSTAEATPEYNDMVSFVKSIFNSVFIDPIDKSKQEFERARSKFLRTFLNFGNNNLRMALNWKKNPLDNNGIIFKLKDALPTNFDENFYISRLIRDPIVVKVSLYSPTTIDLTELKPANFNVNVTSAETKMSSNDELVHDREVDVSKRITESQTTVNVDYRYFENFVMFSSANTRLNNFIEKQNRISKIQSDIIALDTLPFDSYRQRELSELKMEVADIKLGFDGYENFLYDNPEWVQIHSDVGSIGITSASYYDRNNQKSLVNNLAEYIVEDQNNIEFVKFCDVVGQSFDEIFTHVNLMVQNKKIEHTTSVGASDDIINKMLSILGWGSSGNEDEDLFINLFGETPFGEKKEDLSARERRNIIWRRLLNNLPYILKSKGTVECIRTLFNIYGIPRTLYTIKEFSSVPNNDDNRALYIFDNDYYAVHFSGSNEYFKCDWNASVNTIEFKFSFDVDKLHEKGSVFRLAGLDDNWVVGAIRDKIDNRMGRVFFTLASSPGDVSTIKTLTTKLVPIFDGQVYTVMVRKNAVSDNIVVDTIINECGKTDDILTQAQLDIIPTKYDLVLKRATDDRISIESTTSYFFSQSFNESFYSGSNLYIGNFSQLSSSITPDPNAFYGTIDQVKLYDKPLSNKRFDSHVFYVDAYDVDDVKGLTTNLLMHLRFDKPQDLFSGSSASGIAQGYIDIPNDAFYTSSIQNIKAYNFPKLSEPLDDVCDDCCEHFPKVVEVISGSFPWHFKKFQSVEHVRVPNFGGSSFKNNRIFYDDTTFSGSLYIDVKSNNPKDKSLEVGSVAVGVFFSPTEEENKEILKFFGDFNVGDFIGDPKIIYDRQYSAFNRFKKVFYDTFSGVSFHDYMTLVRNYVDKSIYTNLEKMMPARAKLKSGILIESSVFDRNKIQYKPLTVEVIDNGGKTDVIQDVNGKAFFGVTKDNSINWSDIVEVDTGKNKGRYQNINKDFFPDVMDPPLFSIYSNNGVVRQDGRKYFAEIYQETHTITDNREKVEDNQEDYWKEEISVERLNLIPIPDEFEVETKYTIEDSNNGEIFINIDNFTGSLLHFDAPAPNKTSDATVIGMVPPSTTGNVTINFLSGSNTILVMYSPLRCKVDGVFSGSYTTGSMGIQGSDTFGGSLTGYLVSGSISLFTKTDELGVIRNIFSDSLPHGDTSRVFIGYSKQHRRNKRQFFNSVSIQDNSTTVDSETGLLNGSEPVEVSAIDRGVINVETEGEGIILEGDN